MTALQLALARAQERLLTRLENLEARLAASDENAWPAYCETAVAIATITAQLAPEATGRLLTTRELAARIGVAPKTLLRRKARGQITPALQLGQRGRAALRWAVPQ